MSRKKGHDEIYCRSCGEPIKKMAEICPECGVPNEYSDGQEISHHSQRETQRKSTNKRSSQGGQDYQRAGKSVENFFDSLISSEQTEHDPSKYQTTISGKWHYGVGASIILWIVGISLSEVVSSISALSMLVAWGFMPVSIYFDREFLRATTNWNPSLIVWIVLAVVPLINIVAGVIYLFRRYNSQQVSSPRGGTRQGHEEDSALQELRERYSRGELTDREFEEKVEQIVGTENKETAEIHMRGKETSEEEESK